MPLAEWTSSFWRIRKNCDENTAESMTTPPVPCIEPNQGASNISPVDGTNGWQLENGAASPWKPNRNRPVDPSGATDAPEVYTPLTPVCGRSGSKVGDWAMIDASVVAVAFLTVQTTDPETASPTSSSPSQRTG